MSKLYVWSSSDMSKNTATKRGNTNITSRIHWGSRDDSKLAIEVEVTWPKGDDKPSIKITKGKGIKLIK